MQNPILDRGIARARCGDGYSVPKRYEPRDHVSDPDSYGDPRPGGAAVVAKAVPGRPATWTAMAWLQHVAAREVRGHFDVEDRTQKERLAAAVAAEMRSPAAEQPAVTNNQLESLYDKLHGRRPATFEDLAGWALATEVITWPAPRDLAELRGHDEC